MCDMRPPVRYRLKRSVEVYPSQDGSVRLIQEGLGRHFKVDDVSRSDRALLDLLQAGFLSREQLTDELERQGHSTGDLDMSLSELTRSGHLEVSNSKSGLAPWRRERFDRQLIYFSDLSDPGERGETLQTRLSKATVVILGCGGLGSWTACGLACAGVGHLVLVDDDTVELSNLNRQLLFRESDIGRPKVEAAAETLSRYDTELQLTLRKERVTSTEDIRELMDGADMLVGTADWPPYELPRWVNQASIETGVPYLGAGQFPPLIRVGPMVIPGSTACHECQESAVRRSFPMYDELSSFRASRPTTASTLGAASGIIGSVMAMEIIHHLTGAVTPATANRSMVMDLRTLEVEFDPVERDEGCKCSAVTGPQSLTRGSIAA